MKIAIEGCCHGELDKIYDTVLELERQNGFKIDLLLICGDFQAVRNFDDLQAMAVPQKYQKLNTFYKYYNKEKVAPVLTIFIGGNHEASNYMQELPYGGWVAPNIYYMGYAGIIQIGGLRIGGISGIFKGHDFNIGHHEKPPYDDSTVRSVYHYRNLEIFRLKQISRHLDIFLSHDWPKGIYHYGDTRTLIRTKPFLKQEIDDNKLGSGPLSDLLTHLQPSYWFAAHLHVKFAAHVEHSPGSKPAKCTKFLSLDKCLPRRSFLQVVDMPHNGKEELKIKLDPEWLTILRKTNSLLNLTTKKIYMPGPGGTHKYDFKVTEEEIKETIETFGRDLTLPENFVQTAAPLLDASSMESKRTKQALYVQVNPQTSLLCSMLDITDPNANFTGKTSQELLVGLAGQDSEVEEDSGEDVIADTDTDEDELPSTIDSCVDISGASHSVDTSSSFHTANETFLTSGFCTPAKSAAPQDITVEDDDGELLSILSVQKNKKAAIKSLLLPAPKERSSPVCAEDKIKPSCPGQANDTSHISNTDKNSEELEAILVAQRSVQSLMEKELSSSLASGNTDFTSSSCDQPPSSLKSDRSSFGMSGLCLNTFSQAKNMEQLSDMSLQAQKREASGDTETGAGSAEVSSESGAVVKKLKRRNVSFYAEPSE